MPKVTVNVPHHRDPEQVVEKARSVLEKTVKDFDGRDLDIQWTGRAADFKFKSLAFTIQGKMTVQDEAVTVEVDLPFAAMMFKDRVEKAVRKNVERAMEAPSALGKESPDASP
jgi:hypothetical protein